MATRGKQQPSELRPDVAFGRVSALGMSPEFLTPERLALMKKISQNMSRDPAMLKVMESVFQDYADDIRRVVPTEKELESLGLTGFEKSGDVVAIAPVAAAAAVAPGAAAMAAGPAFFEM
jgi:hypothetical protein